MADETILAHLARHDDQLAQLAQLVGRLHEVSERHNDAILAVETALARVIGCSWADAPREESRP
jgi:hypothetical protein